MPSTLDDSDKRRIFRQLLAEKPGADPLELAKQAGFSRPAQALERMQNSKRKLEERAKLTKLSDRERAQNRLRTVVEHGSDAQAVHAAKALLEASPTPASADGSGTLVVFRGYEGTVPGTQQVSADISPEELAAAIAHVRTQRAQSTDAQLAQHALDHRLDSEELSLAWELYQHAEARAAALRVYLMAQPAESTDDEAPEEALAV